MSNLPDPPQNRAPYGRSSRDTSLAPTSYSEQLPAAYEGQTYYGLPAIKKSHYGELITAYFFIGGVAGGAQLIAQAADLVGDEDDRSVVRNGRYLALAGAVISPVLLIADLHYPRRWYNMLRIVRPTSAMSIGAWTLMAFGTFSGGAALAQFLEDVTRRPAFRLLARMLGIPAAATATVLTTYTGTLLAATSTPFWSAGGRLLPVLFGTSAMSTATAALSLAEEWQGREESLPKLETIALLSGAAEAVVSAAIHRRWKDEQVAAPLEEEPLRSVYRAGFQVLGLAAPLAVHAALALRRRPLHKASLVAAAATLAGGYLLRHVIVSAGNRSARRPRDYFRSAQK